MTRLVLAAPFAAFFVGACASTSPKPEATDPTGSCADDEVLDGETCVPAACGIGPWGDVSGDVWVDAAAPDGGDGSAEHPLRTLQEGADAAASMGGGTVAVAAGTYVGTLALTADHDDVTLRGRCPERVSLDASGGAADYPAVALEGSRGTSAALEGLTIADAAFVGIGVLAGTLTVTDVRIDRPGYAGLYVQGNGAVATVAGLTVTDPVPLDGYASGFGVEVRAAGRLDATGLTLTGATTAAVNVHEASSVTLDGWTVAGVYPEPGRGGGYGRGVLAKDGSDVILASGDVSAAVGFGIVATDEATVVTLDGVRVHGILSGPDGVAVGVGAGEGGAIVGGRVTVDDLEGSGLWAVGGAVELADVGVSDIRGATVEVPGAGVFAEGGGSVVLTRATIGDCVAAGVWAAEDGFVSVDDGGIGAIGLGRERESHAVVASDGGEVALSAVSVEAGPYAPVVASGALSRVELTGVDVTSAVVPDPGVVVGVAAEDGAYLSATDSVIAGGWGVGLSANGGAINLHDVEVSGVQEMDGDFGYGASAVVGGILQLSGVRIRDVQRAGISASDAYLYGADLDIADVHGDGDTRGIDVEACDTSVRDSTVSGLRGFGVVATGGTLEIVRGEIVDLLRGSGNTAAVGVALQSGAVGQADELTVARNEGPGIQVYRASLVCTDCTFEANAFAGLVVVDGDVSLVDGQVDDTGPDVSNGGGIGVYAARYEAATTVTLDGTRIGPHPYAAAWVDGATFVAVDTDLSGGPGVDLGLPEPVHGNGLFAGNGASVSVTGGAIHDAAIAVLLDGVGATFTDTAWWGNVVDVQEQRCDGATLVDPTVAPAVVLCPDRDALVVPVAFALNFVDASASPTAR